MIRNLVCCLPSIAASAFIAIAAPLNADDALAKSLTLHASFDHGFDADFSRGDKSCHLLQSGRLVPCTESEALKRTSEAGRFGKGLWFTKKDTVRPLFIGKKVLGYNPDSWSATVSLWMRLDPDLDLEPGYCDPIQIVGDDTKKGFVFLEWSKDHTPRHFRYAIRPLIHLWNPDGLAWEEVPYEKRPMVELKTASFSRETWTHAVFTLDRINEGKGTASGSLYLNGRHQGDIKDHELLFEWNPDAVKLVLGAAYVGHLDDLAVFDRVLAPDEIARLHQLENGVADLVPTTP